MVTILHRFSNNSMVEAIKTQEIYNKSLKLKFYKWLYWKFLNIKYIKLFGKIFWVGHYVRISDYDFMNIYNFRTLLTNVKFTIGLSK